MTDLYRGATHGKSNLKLKYRGQASCTDREEAFPRLHGASNFSQFKGLRRSPNNKRLQEGDISN